MQDFLHEGGFEPRPVLEAGKWQAAASPGEKLEPAVWDRECGGISWSVCLDHGYPLIRSGLRNEADCGWRNAAS